VPGCQPWHTWVSSRADGPASLFDAAATCPHALLCAERLSAHQRIASVAESLASAASSEHETDANGGLISEAGGRLEAVHSLARTQLHWQAACLSSNLRNADTLAAQDAITQRHAAAVPLALDATALAQPLSLDLILRTHKALFGEAGGALRRPGQAARCGTVVFAPAECVAAALAEYVAAINILLARADASHLGVAAAVHEGLVATHPFSRRQRPARAHSP